jgi:uncharacterized YccA/Bax inhibitor family protein
MNKFLEDFIVAIIGLFGTSVVGFILSLSWFRAVGRDLDSEAISLSAKIFGGIFVGGILLFFAFKFL